jgi:uncharacterized protein (TIGR02145 family)
VLVENQKEKTSLMLNGNSVLQLNVESEISAVNAVNPVNETFRIYPNPATEQSTIQFRINEAGNILVSVYDLCGKIVLQSATILNPGIHHYIISGLGTGIYNVRVCEQEKIYSARLISLNNLSNKASIEYVSSQSITNTVKSSTCKTANDKIEMVYKEGERLKLTGYSGNYKTVLTTVPGGNNTITFNFMKCTDADSNHYPVVKIGEQTWMAENLKTTHYSNGKSIPLISGNNSWAALSLTDRAYCWYNDDSTAYAQTYGVLYNWLAAMDSTSASSTNPSGVQGVCPTGWHLPSDTEWKELTDYLGGMNVAGGKLKETGTTLWAKPNTAATNETGFSALPAGARYYEDGTFFWVGEYSVWWGASEVSAENTWGRGVYYADGTVYRVDEGGSKRNGLSVRCVKDEE